MPASGRPIPIAYVHPYSALYGSEQSMLVTLRQLDRAAFAPRLLLPRDGPLVAAARDAGVDVDLLPWLSQARSPRAAERLATALRLGWWLRQRGIRLLHLNMWENGDGGTHLLASTLAGAGFLLGIRCRVDEYLTRRDQLWLSRTGRIVTVSENAIEPILVRRRFDRFWHVRRDQIRVIAPSRDLARLHDTPPAADATLAAMGLRVGNPLVGTVAAINAIKRPEIFVHAAAVIAKSHPAVQFVMVGDAYIPGTGTSDQYVAGIKQLAHELGLDGRIVFAGFRHDAVALMKRFDVLVISSAMEGHSGVAIEAMALGIPLVAAAVGGISEMLRGDDAGMLMRSSDPAAYAAAIARYLDDAGHATAVTARARVVAARYDAANASRELESCYREMLQM